jgi:hypothetical protein
MVVADDCSTGLTCDIVQIEVVNYSRIKRLKVRGGLIKDIEYLSLLYIAIVVIIL